MKCEYVRYLGMKFINCSVLLKNNSATVAKKRIIKTTLNPSRSLFTAKRVVHNMFRYVEI